MKCFAIQRTDEYKESQVSHTMSARDYKSATDLILMRGGPNGNFERESFHDTNQSIDCPAIVRRLTPLECERLQGFPDQWTNIGDWTDEKGKIHKYADTPRYRAVGNSIALPFWQYLARRICAQYERDITMGSLFAGIGGFELVFQRTGAEPIWSCEIEPYCQAVLREHFPEDET